MMKNFSLVRNDGYQYPEAPQGIIVVFGNKRDALAYTDYDGRASVFRPQVDSDWFPLSREFDSVMAWHGERKKINGKEHVQIKWRKR